MKRNFGPIGFSVPHVPLRDPTNWSIQIVVIVALLATSASIITMIVALRHLARMVFPHA
jgi:hypothetical protein